MPRYRLQFTAKKTDGFDWDVNEVKETDELLELIFAFQMMIAKEFKIIMDESKKIVGDDDIPF